MFDEKGEKIHARVPNNFDVKKDKFLNSINYKYLPGFIKEKYAVPIVPMVTSNIKTSSDFFFMNTPFN